MGDVALPFRDLLFRGLNLRFFVVYELRPEDRRAALADLDLLLEMRALSTRIAQVFPLEAIVAAHEAVERGAAGNVVIEIA
jgi:NADPH2:quinone reductase